MQKFYSGIGSRNTPKDVLHQIEDLSAELSTYILRSGGAPGADTSFEIGAKRVNAPMRIYLPWRGFNNNRSPHFGIGPKALEIASEIHPYWTRLRSPVKNLMGRNVYQILGYNLITPSKFVVCWTPDGCISHTTYHPEYTGGTGLAIALASLNNIPVFNLRRPGTYQSVLQFIREGRLIDVH